MTRTVGYTRPLLDAPDDVHELREAGAQQVVEDVFTPKPVASSLLRETLAGLADGDVLVVSSGARLASSVGAFLTTVTDLRRRGVAVRVLDEPALSVGVESGSADEMLLALDRLRRSLISLRTRRGMAEAAHRGRRPGRPSVMTEGMTAIARELQGQRRSVAHIARVLGVSPGTVTRALNSAPSDRAAH